MPRSALALSAVLSLAILSLAIPAGADAVDDEEARGVAAAKAGDYETAATAFTKAVGLARKQRGKNDPSVGPLALEAGKALLEAHKIDRAVKAFGLAVKNAQVNHGKASIKNAEPLRMYALALERNSDRTKARTVYEELIKLLRRTTGEDSLRTANALVAAAELDIRTQNFGVARRRLRDAMRGFKKAGATSTRDLAEAQVLSGIAYILDSSDWKKYLPLGGELLREGIQNYERSYPLGSPEVIAMYEQLLAQLDGTPVAERMGDKLTGRLAEHKAAKN